LIASPPPIDLGRASGVQSLPPFSPVACRLCQLITDERVHFREVAQVFALDAALSSQVLRVANSALVGCRHQIASIVQAVMMVGADRVRDIAVTVAMKNYMGEEDNTFLHRCWRHNLATALWCERLVEYCDLEPSAAYTAGLLHDIGRIALLMLFRTIMRCSWTILLPAAWTNGKRNASSATLIIARSDTIFPPPGIFPGC
jgi:HD-like signal output (HDOD) protein